MQEEWKEEDKKLEKQWESEETENQDTEDKNTANKDTENDSTAAGREESVGNTNPKNSQLQIIKVRQSLPLALCVPDSAFDFVWSLALHFQGH